jgi:hypothetical protein
LRHYINPEREREREREIERERERERDRAQFFIYDGTPKLRRIKKGCALDAS